jgi:hypothetical protein
MASDQTVDQHVYAGTLFQEPGSGAITGVRFHVWLRSGRAAVTIEDPPPSVDLSHADTFRAALWELAAILSEAARSPDRILWHLPDKR